MNNRVRVMLESSNQAAVGESYAGIRATITTNTGFLSQRQSPRARNVTETQKFRRRQQPVPKFDSVVDQMRGFTPEFSTHYARSYPTQVEKSTSKNDSFELGNKRYIENQLQNDIVLSARRQFTVQTQYPSNKKNVAASSILAVKQNQSLFLDYLRDKKLQRRRKPNKNTVILDYIYTPLRKIQTNHKQPRNISKSRDKSFEEEKEAVVQTHIIQKLKARKGDKMQEFCTINEANDPLSSIFYYNRSILKSEEDTQDPGVKHLTASRIELEKQRAKAAIEKVRTSIESKLLQRMVQGVDDILYNDALVYSDEEQVKEQTTARPRLLSKLLLQEEAQVVGMANQGRDRTQSIRLNQQTNADTNLQFIHLNQATRKLTANKQIHNIQQLCDDFLQRGKVSKKRHLIKL